MSVLSKVQFDQLPLEVLFGIFRFLDIPAILQIRRVSCYLSQVSRLREIWTEAYRHADFVRPPGPFPSQSALDLESTLVRSFRADWYLRHNKSATPKLSVIQCAVPVLGAAFVFGRFLLIAHSNEIRCYDLEHFGGESSGSSIIYRSIGKTLRWMHCVSAIDIEGRPIACAVLREALEEREQIQISIYLLEQSKLTLDLLYQSEHREFLIGTVNLGPRVIVVQGTLDPARDVHDVIVLDVRTRTQFLLPALTNAALASSEMAGWTRISIHESISTSTHLLLARSFFTPVYERRTVFYAFALPPPNPLTRSITLTHSYHGIIHGVVHAQVLHDSIVNPSTHDTVIGVQVGLFEPSSPCHNFYGYICLSGNDDAMGTVTLTLLGSFTQHGRIPFMRPSFGGMGRAFYFSEGIGFRRTLAAVEYDIRREGCVGATAADRLVAYPCVVQFPTRGARAVLDYDHYFGRICFHPDQTNTKVIEIVDLV